MKRGKKRGTGVPPVSQEHEADAIATRGLMHYFSIERSDNPATLSADGRDAHATTIL